MQIYWLIYYLLKPHHLYITDVAYKVLVAVACVIYIQNCQNCQTIYISEICAENNNSFVPIELKFKTGMQRN